MLKQLENLVSDERTVTERVITLLLATVLGVLVGMLLSPPERIIIGSYNGNYQKKPDVR